MAGLPVTGSRLGPKRLVIRVSALDVGGRIAQKNLCVAEVTRSQMLAARELMSRSISTKAERLCQFKGSSSPTNFVSEVSSGM